jgi:hypothetical protein
LETVGDLHIKNESSGESCVVTFKQAGWTGPRNLVTGVIQSSCGKEVAWLQGACDSHLEVRVGSRKKRGEQIWEAHPWPAHPEQNWGFTKFGIELNDLTANIADKLPPSDSRLRPDQRLVEQGRFDDADRIKKVLEERQRERKNQGCEYRPQWFKRVRSADDDWEYAGGYWEARESGSLQKTAPKCFDWESPGIAADGN